MTLFCFQSWHCHNIKRREDDYCKNESCVEKEQIFSPSYNILASLTDRTGSLENVRLHGKAAERVLGIDVNFLSVIYRLSIIFILLAIG
jgi:hypothetical protein